MSGCCESRRDLSHGRGVALTNDRASNSCVYASATTHSQLNECNTLVKNLNTDKASLQSKNEAIQNDLKALNSDNNQSKMTIADQTKRLQNLQNLIQSQKDVMSKLKNSIAAALLNYKTDELTPGGYRVSADSTGYSRSSAGETTSATSCARLAS